MIFENVTDAFPRITDRVEVEFLYPTDVAVEPDRAVSDMIDVG